LEKVGSLPERFTGKLYSVNDRTKPVLEFKSFNRQVASFFFVPEPSVLYELILTDDLGNHFTTILGSSTSGISLRAEQTGTEVYVEMLFHGMEKGGQGYRFVAQMQNQLVAEGLIKKQDSVVKLALPVDKMSTGILQLTLFDPADNPVKERLVFVNNGGRPLLPFEIKGEEIVLTDSTAGFEFAMSADSSVRTRSILSDLYLTDLGSYIDRPASYFDGDPEDMLALDALLITEWWRRFWWEELLKGRMLPLTTYKPEGYLSYRIRAKESGRVVPNEQLNLIIRNADSSMQFTQVKTDQFGEFYIKDFIFFDSVKIFATRQGSKKRSVNIELVAEPLNELHPPPSSFPAPGFQFRLVERKPGDPVSAPLKQRLEQVKKLTEDESTLQEVTVVSTIKKPTELLQQKLVSPLFMTQNEAVLDILNDEPSIQSYSNIFDWLDGRVAGLNFRILNEGDKEALHPISGQPDPAKIGRRIPMMRDQSVSLYIDENPTDIEGVYGLPTSEIALVKVIKGYFVGATGGGAGGGAIAIYTRRAGLEDHKPVQKPFVQLKGYDPPAVQSDNWFPTMPLKKELGSGKFIITGLTKDGLPIYLIIPADR
jgi:hypothetical protein